MKRSIDEDIIQRRIRQWEADNNNQTTIDSELLWDQLHKKIHPGRTKKIPLTFYWAAAALVITIIIFGLQNREKNSTKIDNVVANVPRPLQITAKNKPANNLPAIPMSLAVRKEKPKTPTKTRHHHNHVNDVFIAENQQCNRDCLPRNIEKYSPLGQYATPAVSGISNNTTTEKGLLCY